MNKIIKKLGISSDDGMVDETIIEQFEQKTGYCFPKNYKILLSTHNGLYPMKSVYDFINVYGKQDKASIYFLGYGNVQFDKIIDSLHISDPIYYGILHLVAFGGFGNGDYICFDYRHDPKTCDPKVVHVYHDDYTENKDGTSSMTVNFVANSFEEFIDMLYEDADD